LIDSASALMPHVRPHLICVLTQGPAFMRKLLVRRVRKIDTVGEDRLCTEKQEHPGISFNPAAARVRTGQKFDLARGTVRPAFLYLIG
jgi:hypothetical protein